MAELKTKPTSASVRSFINSVDDDIRRGDCAVLLKTMRKLTRRRATMWGESMVGFGAYHYHYRSGREGDWFLTGFSPRKRDLTVYIMPGFDSYREIMSRLGKYRLGRSCLYIKRLADVDMDALNELIAASLVGMARIYKLG